LEKEEGKRALGRPRRKRMDNIWMDLQEVGGGYADWMVWPGAMQLLDACECGNESSGSIKTSSFNHADHSFTI